MEMETHQKVTANHLKRNAYLYVRQSTLRQVFENTESTQRQYALGQRAVALGWQKEQIVIIDSDLGQSGASATDREGFQRLVTEVGMGRAGIVMGLEVSRLARNCSDWHRLLEICALAETLILDEDGIYDPAHFNDRLLLGLKGTMSEAELHVLRARLRGGMLNKARRGELAMRLPIGFVYESGGSVVLNPDKQIQQSVCLLFETFRRVGSAYGTVRAFREQGLQFPKRIHCGLDKGEIVWRDLTYSRVMELLHNPRYAGAYAYGCRGLRRNREGRLKIVQLPPENWQALVVGAHEGYIAWQEYQENQNRLQQNGRGHGADRRCPPREGPALLQGLAICGICGCRMSVRYHRRRGSLNPDYVCQGPDARWAQVKCQSIPGDKIDQAISRLLLETVTPVALEIALVVQQELQARIEETDKLRHQKVERARYEADLARRRYMKVDPENRLVADSLEGEWNSKLRALTEAELEYERRRQADRFLLDEQMRERILALAADFPNLWRNPQTPDRERKRMVRLIIEDVTLIKKGTIAVHVRFKGGATKSLTLPRPLNYCQERQTPTGVVAEIDRLLDRHTDGEIAAILNERGFRSGSGKEFHSRRVRVIRRAYRLKSRYTRLREAGLLTLNEVASNLGISKGTVKRKRAQGLLGLDTCKLNDEGQYMYYYTNTNNVETCDSKCVSTRPKGV
ncbi:MAG: recombinase family protein [Anaerolineae bacterium]|nr:recombinase family protein [Anaerolineae bacterium]